MLDSPRNLLVRNLLRSAFFLFFRKESLSSDLFSFSLILQFYFIQEYCFLVLDSSNTEFPDILSWILWNHSVLQYFDGRQIPDLGSRRTMMRNDDDGIIIHGCQNRLRWTKIIKEDRILVTATEYIKCEEFRRTSSTCFRATSRR